MSRRTALVVACVAVLAAAVFVLLTVYAGVRSGPTAADLDVQRAFVDHRSHVVTALARTLTYLGSSPELYVALAAVVVVGWRRGRIRLPLCCLLWFAAG